MLTGYSRILAQPSVQSLTTHPRHSITHPATRPRRLKRAVLRSDSEASPIRVTWAGATVGASASLARRSKDEHHAPGRPAGRELAAHKAALGARPERRALRRVRRRDHRVAE